MPFLGFFALLAAFWFTGQYFGVAARLGGQTAPAFVSFALLLAPYWGFGFGLADVLRRILNSRLRRAAASSLLVIPYLVEALPTGTFRWDLCLGFLAVVAGVSVLLEFEQDWPVLAGLALAVESHVFDAAWPVTGFAKLLFVDAALFGYLVVRPIPGIGFDFRARWSDLLIGLREFAYYTPVALALGFALGFLHLHRAAGSPAAFAAAWIFTIFFIAMPEELFFRGLLLNLLERRLGTRAAFWITSIAFGLAHFNKRTTGVNWRYVILAAIAGCFYARAWLARRRLLASSITHATVDTVWSIWLR